MRLTRCLIASLGIVALLLCLLNVTGFAQETIETSRFPENVIEVPQGTAISIDDDAMTVTITDTPVEISGGDTFIVYLQDLPIGYVANTVITDGNNTIISVKKADKSVYTIDEEEGVIELTPDICEFIPEDGVTIVQSAAMKSRSISLGDTLSYENGTLKLQKSYGGNTVVVSLSNMRLTHSVSNGNLSLALQGNWNIQTPVLSTSEDILEDIPLVSIRIAGIGKITLKLSMTMSLNMTCDYSGTFTVGFNTANGEAGNASSSFTVSNKTVSGKGKIEGALKITGGVDILFAAADLYGEIGIGTDVQTQSKTNSSTHETVYCENYRFYLFLRAGVEAEFKVPNTGIKKNFKGSDFGLPEELDLTRHYDIHFENGQLVSSCSQGMSIHENHAYDGGFETNFGSTLFTDGRERVLETNVDLPWDLEIDGDYRIANGNLNLNGNTLIINGDLIQSGGTLTVGSGTLIVNGDYRLQTYNEETDSFENSTGNIIMDYSEGQVTISGDLYIQTESNNNQLSRGTLSIGGDLYQNDTNNTTSNLNASTGCNITMSAGSTHTIRMDSPEDNSLGTLVVMGDTTIPFTMHLEGLDIIDSELLIDGDLIQNSGTLHIGSGMLTVSGSLKLHGGTFDGGEGSANIGNNINHFDGTLTVNAGTINVHNCYLNVGEASIIDDTYQGVESSRGILIMQNDTGKLNIGDSFITYSTYDHGGCLTNGTLSVSGDFIQIGTGDGNNAYYCSGRNFRAGSAHTTVLNGSERQMVSFESSLSYFGTFRAKNSNIVFRGSFRWLALDSDVYASTEGAWPNYYNINHDPIPLNGHKLTIQGNMLHSQGMLSIDGGELHVTGDYCIAGSGSTFGDGEDGISECQGVLSMTNEEDIVQVDGMFLTASTVDHRYYLKAGVMRVGGDFRQIGTQMGNNAYSSSGGANYRAQPEHKTVLNGSGTQVINFDSSDSYFGVFEATNSKLVFSGSFRWITLNSDITAKTNGAWPYYYTVNEEILSLNGHKMTISGNLLFSAGAFILDGGELYVTGDFYIAGSDSSFSEDGNGATDCQAIFKMINTSDVVKVDGTFLTYSTCDHGQYGACYSAGTLCVGKDFYQKGNSYGNNTKWNYSSFNFPATVNHTTVLNGNSIQNIVFEGSNSHFGTLEITNAVDQYVFQPNPCWLALNQPEIPTFGDPELILPAAIISIDDSAFEGIAATVVYIPDNCISIGTNAFKNSSVVQIRIPVNCTIADTAFEGCESVLIFGAAGSAAESFCVTHDNCTFIEE